MNDTRINILGASGSGTTTVGRRLAKALSIPFFDSDDYYHLPTDPPFQKQRSLESCRQLISRDLPPTANWVLSGGVAGWLHDLDLRWTTVVFLYVPVEMRLQRLRRRESARFGSRIQEGGDMQDTHREFMQWTSRYDVGDQPGKSLPKHEQYLASLTCPVMRFAGEQSPRDIVDAILDSIL